MRDGRFVVRARGEIERLLKLAYDREPPVDRLMSGLARVASALNAGDQCLARIAAVHLQMPDLASAAVRDALAAEDWLIKYARDEGGGTDWIPALDPRSGTLPNPGWFATTGGASHRLNEYIDKLARFDGGQLGYVRIDGAAVVGRELSVTIPGGSTTAVQRAALEAARLRAKALDIDLIITEL
jgi:hypothetical protein